MVKSVLNVDFLEWSLVLYIAYVVTLRRTSDGWFMTGVVQNVERRRRGRQHFVC